MPRVRRISNRPIRPIRARSWLFAFRFGALAFGLNALAFGGCGRIGFRSLERSPDDAATPDSTIAAMDARVDSSGPDSSGLDSSIFADSGLDSSIFADSGPVLDSATSVNDAGLTDSGAIDTGVDSGAPCTPVCTNPNGTTSCADGVCQPVCAANYDSCDMNANNGCETPLDTVANCGGCGVACPSGDGVAACVARQCEVHCPWDGVYGALLTIDVSWPATLYAGGTGQIRIPMRMVVSQTGLRLDATLDACDLMIPEHMTINETYRMRFPTAGIDAGDYRFRASTVGTLTGLGTSADAVYDPATLTFGVDLPDPRNSPWPTNVSEVIALDSDRDGEPGVRIDYSQMAPYSAIPVDVTASARAARAALAARVTFAIQATVMGCNGGSVSADTTRIDTHLVGCTQPDGTACTTTQRDFHDASRPRYETVSSSLTMTRAADTATCADIRAMFP